MIAHSGVASRRTAEDLIRDGRVTVDDAPAHLGQKIDPTVATVLIDGLPLPVRPDLVYYLLYKPLGVISTSEDDRGRRTVVDLVPDDQRVYPVGRLDADSEGLLILTNDGDLTNLVTHPRHGVTKTYIARVAGVPDGTTLRRLTSGVDLEDGLARAKKARVRSAAGGEALVEIVMVEGRNREVRRLLAAVGHEVISLVRTAVGPIRDPDLTPGSWRPLTMVEVRELYGAAGAAP
ncbi:MAG TPA: pseudouridine synthase [Acidimicrobiia bacterium]|nr:pseudouridine synthase [Acidimicrobiia bacterium]